MDTRSTPAGAGLLPEARERLRLAILELDRLSAETAWECAAARDYRAALGELADRLGGIRTTADALEHELRALWQQSLTAVG